MAMISYLTNKDELALGLVNSALRLSPESRDSLLLKSKILDAMGQVEEARARTPALACLQAGEVLFV